MRVRLVAGAGIVAVVVALALVLADSEHRQAGSNYVPELGRALTLKGADEYCQAGEILPKDAAALRLLVGTRGRPVPALAVTIRTAGGILRSGRLPAGATQGYVLIDIDRIERTTPETTVCIRAEEPVGRRTVLHGALGRVRLEWLREGRESWFSLLPTVVDRFSLGKANPFGAGLIWVALLLALCAATAAVRLALRELGE